MRKLIGSVLRLCFLLSVVGGLGFMASAVAILTIYEENAKWVNSNYELLKKHFNDEWVAVLNKAVVDHDANLEKLVKRLRKQHGQVYSQIAVEYVSSKELDLIL